MLNTYNFYEMILIKETVTEHTIFFSVRMNMMFY